MRSLFLLPLLLLGGAAPPQDQGPKRLSPAQVYECQRKGGVVRPGNFNGDEFCRAPLADAGKACTDGSQCIGQCMVERHMSDTSLPVPGVCQRKTGDDNCTTILVNGSPVALPCAD